MKKIAILIVLAVTVLLFVSCNREKDPNESLTDPSSDSVTEPITEEAQNKEVYIVKDGKPLFGLVKKERAHEVISELCSKLYGQVYNLTQVNLDFSDDWINPTIPYDENTPEILFGKTNRAESKQVMSETPVDDFAIKLVNNKIVIAAHKPETLVKAYDHFINHSISVSDGEGGKNLIYNGDYIPQGKNPDFFFNDENKLEEYVIVHADNIKAKNSAIILSKAIKSAYGVSLELVTDTVAETDKEIIVGKTSRSFGKEYLIGTKTVLSGEYLVLTKGTKFLLLPGSEEAANAAVSAFCEANISSAFTDLVMIPNNAEERHIAYYGSDTAMTEGSDLRIMSYNILAEMWNFKVPIAGRDAQIAATILAHSPDVIGIQEVTEGWHRELTPLIASKYKFVYAKNPNGEANYSTLAYNTEKVKVVDQGFYYFTYGNSTKLRIVCWGLFERLSDGKRFIVANTHWDLTPELRFREACDQSEYLLSLIEKYKVPVFSTGDFNCGSESYEFKKYIELSGFKDSITYADKVSAKYKSYHYEVGSAPTSTNFLASIDHITCTADVTVQHFKMLTNEIVLNSSDHSAIYIDCSLN